MFHFVSFYCMTGYILDTHYLPRCYYSSVGWVPNTAHAKAPHIHHLVQHGEAKWLRWHVSLDWIWGTLLTVIFYDLAMAWPLHPVMDTCCPPTSCRRHSIPFSPLLQPPTTQLVDCAHVTAHGMAPCIHYLAPSDQAKQFCWRVHS